MAKNEPVSVENLSPHAQSTIQSKQIKGKGKQSFKFWQGLLSELAEFDQATDALQKRASGRMVLFIVLSVVLMIASGILSGTHGDISKSIGSAAAIAISALVSVLMLVCIVFAVVYGVKNSKLKKIDLSNDFHICLEPFLDEISEDVKPTTKMILDLDLSGPTKEKITKKEKIPPGRFDKIVETIYHDPWLHLKMRLFDGNLISLDIENQLISHKRHWKVSRGGKTKYKSKVKWKKLVFVTATLIPKTDELAWDSVKIEQLAQNEKVKQAEKKGAEVCRLVRKYKYKSEQNPPEETVKAAEVVGQYMELFSMLTPTKARS